MAHFLRGKQAGIQTDLSAGIIPELFAVDHIARYGVNSQIGAIAYDPVQSLLALGTKESQFGLGQIYVLGQKRVCVSFNLPRRASVKSLHFCADKLISVDSKNDIVIFSLHTKRVLTSYSPPGTVTSFLVDPTLDWAFIGLQNGDVVIYDLDRQAIAPFKIPRVWRERSSRARLQPVISLALHPRDVGTLLIGYVEGAVVYSFKQSKAMRFLQYELPPGAPGGDSDPTSLNSVRHPRLSQALWHPSGTFILTGHEDSSLVIWDAKTGRLVSARTVQDTRVNQPGTGAAVHGARPGTFSVKEPLFRLAWCAKQNPEDTGILVAGGRPSTLPDKGMTFLDLGVTPIYATSSWQIMSDFFDNPKRTHTLPTPLHAEVVDFCLIPRASPHLSGACDPIAVVALLSSGEIATLSFPSGHAISPTNQLHLSVCFVHPFVNKMALTQVDRIRWMGMVENRQNGPPLLNGGAEVTHPLKRYASRNIVQTAHADGTIRLWDAGHGDEIENEDVIQVDLARAMARVEDVEITAMSMSGATGELAAGLQTGEVAIFRWGSNKSFGREPLKSPSDFPRGLTDVADRTDPTLKEGLLPFTVLNNQQGSVASLKMSDVGFVGIGYESGSIAVIDLRGPAVIYDTNLSDFAKSGKRGSVRRSNSHARQELERATVLEFGVMSLEGDDYSSILFFVGTSHGRVASFKLLPTANGGYSVQFVGSTTLDDPVVAISPVNIDSGGGAYASQSAVSNLRNGRKVNGVILVTTQTGARIFKPAAAKGAHKYWEDTFCDSATVVEFEGRGSALVGIFGDGRARAFSIPGLKEIGQTQINNVLEMPRVPEAIITNSGDIVGWTGPSEIAVLNVWGTGQTLPKSPDRLFNPEAPVPPRPTISNMEWISGTQYVAPADLDILIGGADRPMSRRMIEQARSDERQQRSASRSDSAAPSAADGQDEGYWAYMQRQLNERTEKLNLVGDSMEQLQENSAGWANDVNKFVSQQKKKAVMGVIGSKFGF